MTTRDPSAPMLKHDLDHLEASLGLYRPRDAALRVTGDDALSWLQGQVTQDVGQLAPGQSAYGLLLHANGKILADVDMLCDAEGVWLVVQADRLDEVCAHLDRYIMMEDVELDDGAVLVWALQGPGASPLRAGLAEMLEADGRGGVFDVDRLGRGGLLLLVPAAHEETLMSAIQTQVLAAGGALVSDDAVELARLRAGRPKMGVDFGADTLPQVAGLKARALSFSKGCYRGQEPVVMLEHRGSPPKRLVRLEVDADRAPAPGAALLDAEGKSVGSVTSARVDEQDKVVALGLLKRAHDLDAVRAVASETAPHTARALAYVE